MPFANNGEVQIYWRQDGSDGKPPLLLLHPILSDHGVWDRMIPFLADHFRLVRMDLRGHGASSASPSGDGASLADLAADAWAVLRAAEVDRTLVCGTGVGGLIALHMASSRPERLAGIAVAHCTTTDQSIWAARIAEAREVGLEAIVAAALDRGIVAGAEASVAVWKDPLRRVMRATSIAGYCDCAAAILEMDIAPVARAIAVPTLVLAGTADTEAASPTQAHRIVELVPRATACPLPGGAFAALENPGAFASTIAGFFDALRPDGIAQDPARNGERVRREVLGNAWVDRSIAQRNAWIADYQDYATQVAWHTIWGRKGLDYRTRRLLVLAVTAALGRWEEFRLHARSGIERGSLTVQDIKEVSLQAGLYAGVPVANTAFAECSALFRDMGIATDSA